MAKKKLPPMVEWTLDADFYSYEVHVKARTKGEARKKAMAKLQKVPISKYIHKSNTSLEKRWH